MKTEFLILALVANAEAFKFLSNFKATSLIPRPSAMLKKRKAKAVFGDKKLAVITGASSGLGLQTAAELLRTGEYHVFGAVRDMEKMSSVAKEEGFSDDDFTPLQVELNCFASVHEFCGDLNKARLNRPIDRLICNAAVYQPTSTPEWSVDGHAQTLQVNFLSHFLLVSLLLPGITKANDPRVIMVGGASADESVVVYPRADLGALDGLKAGAKKPVSMLDGFNYEGAKAYKDSKLCLSMLSNILHDRYHKQTGIAFSTIYPGVIAESALFEDKPPLDTSTLGQLREAMGLAEVGSVSLGEAAQRLFQVAHDGRCSKSGLRWSWLEGQAAKAATEAAADDGAAAAHAGWETIYENEPSEQVLDVDLSQVTAVVMQRPSITPDNGPFMWRQSPRALDSSRHPRRPLNRELGTVRPSQDLWKHSTLATGASWPPAYQPRSPCPTLVVVGAITKAMNAKEEAKRTLEGLEDGMAGKKAVGGVGLALDVVAGNTIGRATKLAQDKLLGGMVDEAVQGSFQQTVVEKKGRKAKQAEAVDDTAASQEDTAAQVEDVLLAGELQQRVKQLADAKTEA